MQFDYVPCESGRGKVFRPCLPVIFSYEGKELSIGHALVDTGSDITILPIEMAHVLKVELDDTESVAIDCAGGAVFHALPSRRPIGYTIAKKGFRSLHWEGTAYFAQEEPVVLLGRHQCLEKFDLNFQGPEKVLGLLPRFRV